MYLKKAKAWADAYYKSTLHEYVMAFMGCHIHGCQMCFDLSTMNTNLNKYMGDLYRKTMRWIARVTTVATCYLSYGNANGEILSKRTVTSMNI